MTEPENRLSSPSAPEPAAPSPAAASWLERRRARVLVPLTAFAAGCLVAVLPFWIWPPGRDEPTPRPALTATPAAAPEAQPVSLSSEEKKLLRAWRPMTGTLAESHPVIQVLIKHRMTREHILHYLNKSVFIDKRNSPRDNWYVPVAPSQGFDLIFDASGRLVRVVEVGGVLIWPAVPATSPAPPATPGVRP